MDNFTKNHGKYQRAKKTISAKLNGLVANTVYHFRLIAQNSVGTKYGNDYTFHTSADTLPESFTSYKILTEQSSQLTVNYGEYIKVFGSAGVNIINVKSGGRVQCVNFVGSNVVNIDDDSAGFTVYRSGAMVYLENSTTGKRIKIPATKTAQTLKFGNSINDSFELIITNGKVMIGGKEVTLTKVQF
ncbi:MAG: hypothetical protein HQK70_07800 [Desulfamplus sp.]|nr:hypothetical protein [Desulfamplus sp.]